MFQRAPTTSRAAAHVHSSSSSDGSGAAAIRVPGLARKFWTITSWTWPKRSWSSRIASRASSRSRLVSPIPIRIPVVNGRRAPPPAPAHVRPPSAPRRPREGAVAADVAAELRQRDEDLGRIGNEPAVAELPQPPGLPRQRLPRLVDEPEGLDRGESLTHGVSLDPVRQLFATANERTPRQSRDVLHVGVASDRLTHGVSLRAAERSGATRPGRAGRRTSTARLGRRLAPPW